jgi:hypothetical protein
MVGFSLTISLFTLVMGVLDSTITPPAKTSNYSTSMALSIIAHQQGIVTDNTHPGAALEAGIVQRALAAHNAYHGSGSSHEAHPEIQEYLENSTASAARYMADTIGDLESWPLDRLSSASVMLADEDRRATTYARPGSAPRQRPPEPAEQRSRPEVLGELPGLELPGRHVLPGALRRPGQPARHS